MPLPCKLVCVGLAGSCPCTAAQRHTAWPPPHLCNLQPGLHAAPAVASSAPLGRVAVQQGLLLRVLHGRIRLPVLLLLPEVLRCLLHEIPGAVFAQQHVVWADRLHGVRVHAARRCKATGPRLLATCNCVSGFHPVQTALWTAKLTWCQTLRQSLFDYRHCYTEAGRPMDRLYQNKPCPAVISQLMLSLLGVRTSATTRTCSALTASGYRPVVGWDHHAV